MGEVRLGRILGDEAQTDAVHVPIRPIVAPVDLTPGQHVDQFGSPDGVHVAIVDPFLKGLVRKGQRVYLCVYPNTITSLRHEWTHPAFTTDSQGINRMSDSEAWLRAYAMRLKPYDQPGEAYPKLIEELKDKEVFGHGKDLRGLGDLDDAEDLRHHAEVVLGIRINWSEFEFSCSC